MDEYEIFDPQNKTFQLDISRLPFINRWCIFQEHLVTVQFMMIDRTFDEVKKKRIDDESKYQQTSSVDLASSREHV